MSIDPALQALADEELAAAVSLGWRQLSKVAPWGDTYEGFAPGGRAVLIERNYLWKDAVGGALLVEVAVFPGDSRYDQAARANAVLSSAG